jgi:hypothetical protein
VSAPSFDAPSFGGQPDQVIQVVIDKKVVAEAVTKYQRSTR